MIKLTEHERNVLLPILTRDEPLGSSNADEILDIIASTLLFERQNDLYREFFSRPGIIVGRRGSGKTALLNMLRYEADHEIVISISASNAFPGILRSIREVFGDQAPFVEVVEKIWDVLLWSAVCSRILELNLSSDARIQTIRDYANSLSFNEKMRPEHIIENIITFLIQHIKRNESLRIESELQLHKCLDFGFTSFEAARDIAKEILKEAKPNGSRLGPALVLMDTLEAYRLERDDATHAVGGLVRYLGHQAPNKGLLELRFCLPAELYQTFLRASHNPIKDFSSQRMLHWHAGDLLKIAAHRLFMFFNLYDRDRYAELDQRYNIENRNGAVAFFENFLPNGVRKRNSIYEPALAYVLRHTQLLPRHLLDILNKVISECIETGGIRVGRISEDAVLSAVDSCIELILRGINQAFSHRYPYLEEICTAAIPELKLRFTSGDLHKVYNQHVKGVIKRAEDKGMAIDLDFESFRRMFVEIGAIGRQIAETDFYIEAEFEYTVPSSLVIASDDMLCLHPIFSSAYPRAPINQQDRRYVYPYGSNPKAQPGRHRL
jgi:hypothetical protein